MADRCIAACLPGSRRPPSLQFANAQWQAVGDSSVRSDKRITLGILFPADAGVKGQWMFFDRARPGSKVLEAACATAGLPLDKGRIAGSPERLNLFTSEGDLLRIDLELEAHVPSTLVPGGLVILEKGNRLSPERLRAIQDVAQQEQRGGGVCAIM